MFGHPGKKLIFMGGEFAQWDEWKDAASLDWHLHRRGCRTAGVQRLVARLQPALPRNCPRSTSSTRSGEGFEWIEYDDARNAVLRVGALGARAGEPRGRRRATTPVVRLDGYRIGVPQAGTYRELLNTDAGHLRRRQRRELGPRP